MPFQSEKQRKYLWANEPEIARDWTDRYGARGGGIMRIPFAEGSGEGVDYNDYDVMIKIEELKNQYPHKYANIPDEQMVEMVKANEVEEIGDWYQQDTLQKMWQHPDRPEDFGLGSMTNWATDRLGSGVNWGREKIGAGIDWGKMAIRGIGNFMAPGLGFLASALRRPDYPSDTMSRSFAIGNPNATLGQQYAGGRLPGQDAFGINTISMMGNYPAYYDQYVRDYDAGKYTHGDAASKFNQRKYAHALAVNKANQKRIARDFTVTAEDDYGAGNYIAPTSETVPAQGGNQGNGGAAAQAAGDLAGGRETWEASPFQRGGIASLWPR